MRVSSQFAATRTVAQLGQQLSNLKMGLPERRIFHALALSLYRTISRNSAQLSPADIAKATGRSARPTELQCPEPGPPSLQFEISFSQKLISQFPSLWFSYLKQGTFASFGSGLNWKKEAATALRVLSYSLHYDAHRMNPPQPSTLGTGLICTRLKGPPHYCMGSVWLLAYLNILTRV